MFPPERLYLALRDKVQRIYGGFVVVSHRILILEEERVEGKEGEDLLVGGEDLWFRGRIEGEGWKLGYWRRIGRT